MVLWTPANYGDGTQVLVDIDPALFTGLVDGDPISTGQDASGNARHMTAAGSARPTWQTAELDGKAVARFDGVDDVGAIADTGLTGQPFVVAMVARFNSPLAADASLLAGSGWSISYDFVTPDSGLVIDLGSPQTVGVALGGQPVTTPLVLVGGYDGTASLFRSESTAVLSAVELGTTGYPDAFNVGANAAGTGEFVAMDLARLIVAEYVDQASVDVLIAYLSWEYGLEATLPPDSPYISAAPEDGTNDYGAIDLTAFNVLSAPSDEQIGRTIPVTTPAGSSDFVALARTNAAGVNEWYQERDSFQVGLHPSQTFTNLSAGGQGLSAHPVDLADYSEVRLVVNVLTAGTTGRLKIVYEVDMSATDIDLTTEFIDLSTTGVKATDWEPIPSGAKIPVFIQAKGYNGNGSENPQIFAPVAHFRR